MHATMRSAETGSKARSVTSSVHRTHPIGVASANVCGALTTAGHRVLAMHRLSVLRMHCRVA